MSDQTKKTAEDWVPVATPIPTHWSYVDFDEAFDAMSTNGIKTPEGQYAASGRFPIVDQGKSFIGGFTDIDSKVINQDGTAIVFGDHTRCFKFITFPFAPGADGTKVLRPASYLLPKFGYYGCLSLKLPDRGYSRHYSFLRRSKFPIAPPKEQDRIVAKIEELFSELDKGVESLTTARELIKAYRQSVFKAAFEGKLTEGWRKKNRDKLERPEAILVRITKEREAHYKKMLEDWQSDLADWRASGENGKRPPKPDRPAEIVAVSSDDISNLLPLPEGWGYLRLATLAQIGSGMSVSKDRSIGDPVEVPYLRVANVQRGKLDLKQMKTMRIEKGQLPQLALRKGDVLFNEGGDRDKLGRGWIWEGQIDCCITQNHVFRASPYVESETHSKFISHWGNTFGQEYFNTEGKQTTNLASINKAVLSAFPVPFPPIGEQAEVLRILEYKLEAADVMDAEIEEGLARAQALRLSILKRAFSGRLVSQDPADEPASTLLERIRAEQGEGSPLKRRTNKTSKKEAA